MTNEIMLFNSQLPLLLLLFLLLLLPLLRLLLYSSPTTLPSTVLLGLSYVKKGSLNRGKINYILKVVITNITVLAKEMRESRSLDTLKTISTWR